MLLRPFASDRHESSFRLRSKPPPNRLQRAMDQSLFFVAGAPVSLSELALGIASIVLLIVSVAAVIVAARARRIAAVAVAQRQGDLHGHIAELARSNAELTGRIRSMGELLGARQVNL